MKPGPHTGQSEGGGQTSPVANYSDGQSSVPKRRKWFQSNGHQRDLQAHQRPSPVLDKRIPVDKEWAWMIVLACAVSHLLVVGYFRSFGIIFVAYQDTFNTSSAVTAWVPAIRTMTFLSVSPFAQALSNKYTSRRVVIGGAFLSTLGLLISSQARHILLIALSDGVIAGIGTTFALSPGLVMVAKYFKRYRPVANGLASSGGSFGMFIIPPLLRYLMDRYTVHGALLVFAGMFLHLILCGALYRPWEFYTRGDPPILKPSHSDGAEHSKKCTNDAKSEKRSDQEQNSASSKLQSAAITSNTAAENNSNSSKSPVTRRPVLRRLMSEPAGKADLDFFMGADYESTIGISMHSIPGNMDVTHRISHAKALTEMEAGLRPRLYSDTELVEEVHRSRRSRHMSEGDDHGCFQDIVEQNNKKCACRAVSPIHEVESVEAGMNKQGKDKVNTNCHIEDQVDQTPKPRRGCCPCRSSSHAKSKTPEATKKKIFEFSLMKNTVFLSFLVGLLLGHYGFSNQLFFLPAHARDIGISKQNAAWMLSAIGISDLVGRIGCGFFANFQLIRKRYIHRTALTVLGVCAVFAPLINSFQGMVAYCCILGLAGGAYVAMVPVVLVDLIGLEKIASGMGLIQMFQGLSVPIGAPLLGLIRDHTGDYIVCFHIFAVTILLGVIVLWLEPCATRYEERKSEAIERKLAEIETTQPLVPASKTVT